MSTWWFSWLDWLTSMLDWDKNEDVNKSNDLLWNLMSWDELKDFDFSQSIKIKKFTLNRIKSNPFNINWRWDKEVDEKYKILKESISSEWFNDSRLEIVHIEDTDEYIVSDWNRRFSVLKELYDMEYKVPCEVLKTFSNIAEAEQFLMSRALRDNETRLISSNLFLLPTYRDYLKSRKNNWDKNPSLSDKKAKSEIHISSESAWKRAKYIIEAIWWENYDWNSNREISKYFEKLFTIWTVVNKDNEQENDINSNKVRSDIWIYSILEYLWYNLPRILKWFKWLNLIELEKDVLLNVDEDSDNISKKDSYNNLIELEKEIVWHVVGQIFNWNIIKLKDVKDYVDSLLNPSINSVNDIIKENDKNNNSIPEFTNNEDYNTDNYDFDNADEDSEIDSLEWVWVTRIITSEQIIEVNLKSISKSLSNITESFRRIEEQWITKNDLDSETFAKLSKITEWISEIEDKIVNFIKK